MTIRWNRTVGPLACVLATASGGATASRPAAAQPEPSPAPEPPADHVTLHGDVFARYGQDRMGDQKRYEFDLPRARLVADVVLDDHFGGRIMVETVPSSQRGSLYGVDGDSYVLRAREAFAEAKTGNLGGGFALSGRMGIVPTLAIGPLDAMWGHRVLTPVGLEKWNLSAPADFGATTAVLLPKQMGDLTVGVFQGEGYHQREQNDGKNVGARLLAHPLAPWMPPKPGEAGLTVLVAGEKGTLGPARATNDRWTAAVAYEHRYASAGADVSLARGVRGLPSQHARVMAGWLRVGPFWGADIVARYELVDPDSDTAGARDQVQSWRAGAGWHGSFEDTARAFDVHLTYGRDSGGELAEAAEPLLPVRGVHLDVGLAF